MPLELAVDAHDLARDGRGIGTYVRALLGRFALRGDVRLTLLIRAWFPLLNARALQAALGCRPAHPLRFANRVPRHADVVWHPWNGTFFRSSRPAVATIHDVVPFARPAADPTRRASQQAPFRETAAVARAIVCDSQFTAGEIQRWLGVDPARLHPIALGVEPVFCPGDLGALPAALRDRRYILYVGAHDEHKNVGTLIAAHRAAFPDGDVALVFTRPNRLAPEAIVCERAALETLVALYRGATIVAVPSLYEGFGLPVLEAMACGAPVLAACASSLPEVGGAVAGYVDDPGASGSWERALRTLASDPDRRARMQREGPPHAATFSWNKCAERTFAVIRATATAATGTT